jgi:two-component system sensor histidine kinase RegB
MTSTFSNFPTQTTHSHLRRLVLLRAIAVAAQCAVLVLAIRVLEMELPWRPMLATIAALALLNGFTWLRLRRSHPVSNTELFVQLCADVLALSALLYWSGGSTNPFVSLFLLPLVIAAATLPRVWVWAATGLTTVCYTLLMKYHVAMPMPHEGHEHVHDMGMAGMEMSDMERASDQIFDLHVLGMWLGFVISAVVVASFVERMANAVRERDAALSRAREETLRDEHIVALGTQAAGAAHELGTPLSTLAVVIGELRHDNAVLPEWRDSLDLLDGQVRTCKKILGELLADARANTAPAMPPERFVAETLDEWRMLRPMVRCHYQAAAEMSSAAMPIDPALRAALLNLLNNAADASPDGIAIETRREAENFILRIHDHGTGLTPETAARMGAAFFTTKKEGRGLGLFLANATIERMGGRVRLFNREEGGTTTEIVLPFS